MLPNKAYVSQNPKHNLGPALAYLIYPASYFTISQRLHLCLMPPIIFHLTLRVGRILFADPQLVDAPLTSTSAEAMLLCKSSY